VQGGLKIAYLVKKLLETICYVLLL
jgi:hypothetical protein